MPASPAAMTAERPYRLLYVVSHPIQYQAPLLKRLSGDDRLDLHVAFHHDFSCRSYRDHGFDRSIRWDVPLTDGFRYTVLEERRRYAHARSMLLEGGYDAVWLHGYSTPLHWRLLPLARRCGLAVLLRGETAALATSPRRPWWKRSLLRRLVGDVDALLAIGSANARFYERLGVARDRIFPMPYAVDNERFHREALAAAPGRASRRRELGLDGNRPVFLLCGKLEERKRPLDAIEAVRRVHALVPRARRPYLLIAGDGPLRSEVTAAARGVEDSVRELGFVGQRELPALYDLCHGLLLLSEHEPWGLVVNEAMSVGRPAVVSDGVGCGEDLVQAGETGFIVPTGDVDATAASIAALVEDPVLARSMGERARRRVASFDFEADTRGLLAALDAVVER